MRSHASTVGTEQGLARLVEELERELSDARRREAATAQVLKAINRSTFNLQEVLDRLIESAVQLTGAETGLIIRQDGEVYRAAAIYGASSEFVEVAKQNPIPQGHQSATGRAVLERQIIHIHDVFDDPEYTWVGREAAGVRTILAVPMLREEIVVGVIGCGRREVRPFTAKQIELVQTFADQAVIAIENTRLFEAEQARTRELTETLEYQTATSEILRMISSSPTDVQPTFDAIAGSARRLCEAAHGMVFRFDGELIHLVAYDNLDPERLAAVRSVFPIPPGRASITARAILTRALVHVQDRSQDPELGYSILSANFPNTLSVPLLREGVPLGAITVTRAEIASFSDRQVELLKTFADQAVIAIENTRLFEEVQTRTRELVESLEYQTATSDVLSVISRSPTNIQPVFDTIAQAAAQLCKAQFCHVFRFDGQLIHFAASHGQPQASVDNMRRIYPIPPGRVSAAARSILTGTIEEIPDIHADPEYHPHHRDTANYCSIVAVPMLKNGRPIGAICMARTETGAFPKLQLELLRTFADQAVIAIENARLFEQVQARTRELTESLEQQTATADVLKVISRSALDVQKVLDALVESAARLCNANDAAIFQVFGDSLRLVAHHGQIPTIAPVGQLAIPLVRGSMAAHAVIDQRPIQVADILAEGDKYPESRKRALQNGHRTALAVPLVHASEAIGVILIRRTEVRPFTDRQIELVNTFADQAVIAIENTRLFEEVQARTRELSEALEQQTATADVLRAISRSTFDLQVVLDTLIRAAAQLCGAKQAVLRRREGERYPLAATYGIKPEWLPLIAGHRNTPGRGTLVGRVALEKRTMHIPDVFADPEFLNHETANTVGFRAIIGTPLLKDGEPIGFMSLHKETVGPFTAKQVQLFESFADQAVIAIENTRLFEQLQTRTSELAKTVEDLEIASQHKNQFVANMSHELRTPLAAILGYAELMQEGFYEPLGQKSLDALTRICSNGKHLLGLINTVLDIAKIESGQFTLNMTEYAIESVVETVRAATESLAQNKKLTLTTSVDRSLPVGLGDEQRLTQVLLNLVGNAIKFTDAGEVSIGAGLRNGHFAVSVTDTGPGIPLDQQSRIFDQFHQVDSSLTKAKGGTGLGLAIAKEIVEMHGGRIWVESTPGKGSTFQMELPTRAEFRKSIQGGLG